MGAIHQRVSPATLDGCTDLSGLPIALIVDVLMNVAVLALLLRVAWGALRVRCFLGMAGMAGAMPLPKL
jgi:hypothetical protein